MYFVLVCIKLCWEYRTFNLCFFMHVSSVWYAPGHYHKLIDAFHRKIHFLKKKNLKKKPMICFEISNRTWWGNSALVYYYGWPIHLLYFHSELMDARHFIPVAADGATKGHGVNKQSQCEVRSWFFRGG